MRKTTLLLCLLIFSSIEGQDRIITTGVPFLIVVADARAAGMADIGVATSTDFFLQKWNPEKYAFADQINYDNNEFNTNFLPANLKIGSGFDFIFDEYNKFALNLELNKSLVPTPQNLDLNRDGTVTPEEYTQNYNNCRKTGWIFGLVKPFGDASDGFFSEELKEVTYTLGFEYIYKDAFAVRVGCFHKSPVKGAR